MTSVSQSRHPKLEAQGIRLDYLQPRANARLAALDGVDLTVMDGEFVSIVGPSGCGKTTLLSVVDGLIAASAGRILVDGQAVTRPGPDRAMVFQEASLLPWRTVLGNVCYGLECIGIRKQEREKRAAHLISLVGLAGFERHYPYQLSGGMQQRVNLARALLVDPKILLMDEPFASLDAQTRELMQEELLRIWLRARKTVLFVTHQIDEAIYLSDRVVVFSRRPGKVKQIIPVNIERPRPLGIKREGRFHAIEDQIWSLIEDDVRAGPAPDANAVQDGPVAAVWARE
jgi:NitT/TauT family transport system ATP-binding protein